jgi:hypothetical protein
VDRRTPYFRVVNSIFARKMKNVFKERYGNKLSMLSIGKAILIFKEEISMFKREKTLEGSVKLI